MSRRPAGGLTALEERLLAQLQDGPQERLTMRRRLRASLPGVGYALGNLSARQLAAELVGDRWQITDAGLAALAEEQRALGALCPGCLGTGRADDVQPRERADLQIQVSLALRRVAHELAEAIDRPGPLTEERAQRGRAALGALNLLRQHVDAGLPHLPQALVQDRAEALADRSEQVANQLRQLAQQLRGAA